MTRLRLLVIVLGVPLFFSALFEAATFGAVSFEAYALPLATAPNESSVSGNLRAQHAKRSLILNEQGAKAVDGRNFVRAEELFKKALSADPKNVTAAFNLASMFIANKNETEAITLLTSYIEKNPSDAGLFARLGDAYFSNGNITLSLDAYQKAHSIAPRYPGLNAKLGTLHTLQGNVNAAREMFEHAIRVDSRDGESLANLCSLYLNLGRSADAVRVAKQALQIKPSRNVYITLGSAYLQLNEKDHALNAFNRAISLGDSSKELNSLVSELRNS